MSPSRPAQKVAPKEVVKKAAMKKAVQIVATPAALALLGFGLLMMILGPFLGSAAASAQSSCPTGAGSYAPSTDANPNMTAVKDAMDVAKQMGASELIVLAMLQTGAVESSGWHNYSNPKVPESANYPNDGPAPTGGDLDSVGVLQQREAGWGTVAERMRPAFQATKFIEKAKRLEGQFATSDPSRMTAQAALLAQAVQVSAYPDKYGSPETQRIVADIRSKLVASGATTQSLPLPAISDPNYSRAAGDAQAAAEAAATANQAPVAATASVGVSNCTNGGNTTGTFVPRGAPVTFHKYGGTEGPAYTFSVPVGPAGDAIQSALNQLGKDYVWAATGPDTFDCSGLTSFAYKEAGITIPRNSTAQDQWGKDNGADVTNQPHLPGDLIQAPGHITMYLGTATDPADPSKTTQIMIEAPQTGDRVKISPLRNIRSYAANSYTRPVLAAEHLGKLPPAAGATNPAA